MLIASFKKNPIKDQTFSEKQYFFFYLHTNELSVLIDNPTGINGFRLPSLSRKDADFCSTHS